MPSNWLSIDSNFPSFTGEESPEQQIRALHNYLFQLREGLQYSLQNLTADNFNAAALQNLSDVQKNEVNTQLQKVYVLLNQMTTEINSISGRVSSVENISSRVTTTEGEIDDLEEWTGTAEQQIGELQRRTGTAEEGIEELSGRVKQLEDAQTLGDLQEAVTGEGGLQERVADLEGAVTGEGGLQEQMDATERGLEKISGAVRVADDGSVTVGSEGKPLRLVGQIYINGVLYEQGGTT